MFLVLILIIHFSQVIMIWISRRKKKKKTATFIVSLDKVQSHESGIQ